MNVVVLQYPSPTPEEVDSPLETGEYLVVPEGGVTLACYPDTSVGIGVYLVLNELPPTL